MTPLPDRLHARDLWTPDELAGDTLALAPALLGSYLVRDLGGELLVGRIVETEAYTPDDPACHASRGETARNRAMFGPPGRAYVYLIYGIHHCFNVVTEPEGRGAAVLVRALEPVMGEAAMAERRGAKGLTNGPGKLCQALDIGPGLNHADLTRPGPLYMLKGEPDAAILRSPRVGISQAVEWPWRFFLAGSPWVSKGPRASA